MQNATNSPPNEPTAPEIMSNGVCGLLLRVRAGHITAREALPEIQRRLDRIAELENFRPIHPAKLRARYLKETDQWATKLSVDDCFVPLLEECWGPSLGKHIPVLTPLRVAVLNLRDFVRCWAGLCCRDYTTGEFSWRRNPEPHADGSERIWISPGTAFEVAAGIWLEWYPPRALATVIDAAHAGLLLFQRSRHAEPK